MIVQMMTTRLQPDLHLAVRARFLEVFGDPHHSMGHDDNWHLQSCNTLTLNVLVNGSPEKPMVWLFEPQKRDDGVSSRFMNSLDDIDVMIVSIQQRLKLPPAVDEG